MKVYLVVMNFPYEGFTVKRAFKSKEKAEQVKQEMADELINKYHDHYNTISVLTYELED